MARTNVISLVICIIFCVIGFVVGGLLYTGQVESKSIEREAAIRKIEDLVHAEIARPFLMVDAIVAFARTTLLTSPERVTSQFHYFLDSIKIDEQLSNASHINFWRATRKRDAERLIAELNQDPARKELGYPPLVAQKLQLDRFKPDELVMIGSEVRPFIEMLYNANPLAFPGRRQVILDHMESNELTISGATPLQTGGTGFIISRAVYRFGSEANISDIEIDDMLGLVTIPYRADGLLVPIQNQIASFGFDLKIYDIGPVDGPRIFSLNSDNLIASSFLSSDAGNLGSPAKPALKNAIFRDVEVAGRLWRFAFWPKATGAAYAETFALWIPILIGLLLGVLGSVIYHVKSSSEQLLSDRVRERTRELEEVQVELKSSRDAAERLSLSDPLTGLSNRRALSQLFERLRPHIISEMLEGSVILFDVDHFKAINDTRGHDFGDRVLRGVADLLRKVAPSSCEIARLGGDEFAILVSSTPDSADAVMLTENLLSKTKAMSSELGLQSFSVSIGVARIESDDRSLSTPFKRADIALYEAKRAGRGGAVFYTSELGQAELIRQQAITDVVDGIRADEFVPYFQPIMNLETEKLYGVEVLARWQHPEKGILTPGAFWAAFEDDKVASEITHSILGKAFREVSNLKKRGYPCGRIAFNSTEGMLMDESFAEQLISRAKGEGLGPEDLKIEVTERILLARDTKRIHTVLNKLSKLGVSVAFDDFGTGFASLSHLRDFPIDCVKLDSSFVTEIDTDKKALAIVSAVTAMSRDLGLTTVAEGIETRGCEDVLLELGCEFGQGFLYGKPMSAMDLEEFIRRSEKQNQSAA